MPRAAFPSGRKFLLLLIAFAVAIIGGVWWSQRPPPEPVHNGQRLSEWVAAHGPGSSHVGRDIPVQAFGPTAVPWLAYTVEHGRHPFIKHGPLPFDNAPEWLRRLLPNQWGGLRGVSQDDERINAMMALDDFGPEAAPAIPTLARVFEHGYEDDDPMTDYAGRALHATGPASWPVVERILEHGNPLARRTLLIAIPSRLSALESLGKSASEAEVAKIVATLKKACSDPNPEVSAGAAWGISICYSVQPHFAAFDSLTDELVRRLSSSDLEVRRAATQLFVYGSARVVTAVPRLIELLDDADDSLRGFAAMALGNMDKDEKRSVVRLRVMAFHDPNPRNRTTARQALQDLGDSPFADSGSEPLPGQ